jgi:MFS family permease
MSPVVRSYLVSRLAAGTGMTLVRATVMWHVFHLTSNEVLLGVVGLVHFAIGVPMLLSGGIIADRHERTRTVRYAQIAAATVSPVLVLASAVGFINVTGLFVAVALLAGIGSFEQPSRASLLVQLVPRDVYPKVVTQAATVQALAFASGPALAGGLIWLGGPQTAYAAHALLMIVSIVTVRRIPPVWPTGPTTPVFQSLREGFAFALSNRVVLGCMALDMFAVILGGAGALLPVFSEEILHVGPGGYGLLGASIEVGALGMAAYMSTRPAIRRTGRALLIAVVVYGLATIVFGLSKAFPLSVLAYAVVGAADQVSVVLRHTAVQLSTPDALRGRVSAINMLFIQASNQLGAFESGLLAGAIGAPMAVVVGGSGAIVVAALFALLFPALRRYEVAATADQADRR